MSSLRDRMLAAMIERASGETAAHRKSNAVLQSTRDTVRRMELLAQNPDLQQKMFAQKAAESAAEDRFMADHPEVSRAEAARKAARDAAFAEYLKKHPKMAERVIEDEIVQSAEKVRLTEQRLTNIAVGAYDAMAEKQRRNRWIPRQSQRLEAARDAIMAERTRLGLLPTFISPAQDKITAELSREEAREAMYARPARGYREALMRGRPDYSPGTPYSDAVRDSDIEEALDDANQEADYRFNRSDEPGRTPPTSVRSKGSRSTGDRLAEIVAREAANASDEAAAVRAAYPVAAAAAAAAAPAPAPARRRGRPRVDTPAPDYRLTRARGDAPPFPPIGTSPAKAARAQKAAITGTPDIRTYMGRR